MRCDMHLRRKAYESLALETGGAQWICSGFNDGLWGLGCAPCAEYLASGRKVGGARFSKFATFNVRPKSRFLAKWLIQEHGARKSHRVASGLERKEPKAAPPPLPVARSAAPPSEEPAALSAEDAALLKGNVPSLADWQAAWAVLSETVSLRKAASLDGKRGACAAHALHRRRKRYRQQQRVMAEVLRRKVRKVLKQATSISLSLDECKYRKIVRFRADLPSAARASGPGSLWRQVSASGFTYSGVLGILDCFKKHALDFEDDHAVTAVKQLDLFLAKFCTARGRVAGSTRMQPLALDEDLKRHASTL